MGLREIGLEDVNWIQLAVDRIQWWRSVKIVMKLRFP
jgi:hypothetical protein